MAFPVAGSSNSFVIRFDFWIHLKHRRGGFPVSVDNGHDCRLKRVDGPGVLIRLVVEVEKRGQRVEADRGC